MNYNEKIFLISMLFILNSCYSQSKKIIEKRTIYLTYKPVSENVNKLLRDAQKLTFEHAIKADDILEQPYLNSDKKVYGMFYQVEGNAATNSQFYATDSTRHFVTGSVYFYAKPNYDSIMPAASYVKYDMQRLMETLKWK